MHESEGDEEQGRGPADGLERGQQADQERGPAHEQNRDEEGVLAADEIPDAPEHDRAEGPHEEARGIGRERRKQRRGVVTLGEEQRREERREGGVQVEVVPLEYRPERGSEDYLALLLDCALHRCLAQKAGASSHFGHDPLLQVMLLRRSRQVPATRVAARIVDRATRPHNWGKPYSGGALSPSRSTPPAPRAWPGPARPRNSPRASP